MAIDKKSFPIDDLVKALTDNDGNLITTQMLSGYMGDNLDTGEVRFYLEPTLQQWLDIKPELIVHSIKLKPSQSPLGGTMIWVKMEEQAVEAEQSQFAPYFRTQ